MRQNKKGWSIAEYVDIILIMILPILEKVFPVLCFNGVVGVFLARLDCAVVDGLGFALTALGFFAFVAHMQHVSTMDQFSIAVVWARLISARVVLQWWWLLFSSVRVVSGLFRPSCVGWRFWVARGFFFFFAFSSFGALLLGLGF